MRPRRPRQPAPPGAPAASRSTAISRLLLAHLAWSLCIVALAVGLIAVELGAACPPGGPLSLGNCVRLRPLAIGVVGLAAGLYVLALSGVVAWVGGLRRRGVADPTAARDWYLLAALVGVPVAPLLAFILLSALR